MQLWLRYINCTIERYYEWEQRWRNVKTVVPWQNSTRCTRNHNRTYPNVCKFNYIFKYISSNNLWILHIHSKTIYKSPFLYVCFTHKGGPCMTRYPYIIYRSHVLPHSLYFITLFPSVSKYCQIFFFFLRPRYSNRINIENFFGFYSLSSKPV